MILRDVLKKHTHKRIIELKLHLTVQRSQILEPNSFTNNFNFLTFLLSKLFSFN